jgi:hypothetical protein
VSQLSNAIAQPNTAAVFAVTYKEAMRRRFRNAELSENHGEYIDEEECIDQNIRLQRRMRSECGGTMFPDFSVKA